MFSLTQTIPVEKGRAYGFGGWVWGLGLRVEFGRSVPKV